MQLSGSPIHLTSSGAVSLVPGTLIGFLVNSTNAGTVVLKDGGSSGTAVTGTITPAAGAFVPCYMAFATSCYATIGGSALDVTFVFSFNN